MSAPERRDDELVAAVRAGDRDAMRELATRCLPLVYTLVGRAAEPDLDVDDIVRETMLGLVPGLPALREPARVRAWVVTIALRRLADARGVARQQRIARSGRIAEPAGRPGPDLAGIAAPRRTPAREQREVAEATRWLDVAHRDLLSLWRLEIGGHLSRADVAAAVALPVPHVAVRVQRMREQLDTARRVGVVRCRSGCLALGEVTAAWDGQPDPLWRKRIARHLQACVGCGGHGGWLAPPERLLAGLPLLAPPPHLAPQSSAFVGGVFGTPTAALSASRLARLVLPVVVARSPETGPPAGG